MIVATRLNGSEIVLNADLIETIEATPDTIVTLVDGTRYVVEESPQELIDRITSYRATVLRFTDTPAPTPRQDKSRSSGGEVVALSDRSEN